MTDEPLYGLETAPLVRDNVRSLTVSQLRAGIELAEERGELETLMALRREYRTRISRETTRRAGGRVSCTG